jgi:ribosome-associated protein
MQTLAIDHPQVAAIVEVLQEKKGLDILLMDLKEINDSADFFVLCTGTSDMHVRSLAEAVRDKLREQGERAWHVEGLENRRWVLLDFVDIVVHVFRQDAREFYALERLWGDAECVRFEDTWHEPLGETANKSIWE